MGKFFSADVARQRAVMLVESESVFVPEDGSFALCALHLKGGGVLPATSVCIAGVEKDREELISHARDLAMNELEKRICWSEYLSEVKAAQDGRG